MPTIIDLYSHLRMATRMRSAFFIVSSMCFFCIAPLVSTCATVPVLDDSASTKIDPTAPVELKLDVIKSKFDTGLVDYTFSGHTFKAQWSRCTANEKGSFVVIFHGSESLPIGDLLCGNWASQVVLKHGFNVIAVSRPSFLGSTGIADFAGPQSVAANVAGIAAAAAARPVTGYWGVEEGVIAAAFTAKVSKNVNWLLLGNGFYDLENVERSTKNESIKLAIQNQKKIEGDVALERRSIAWDSSNLPKIISLYHTTVNDDAQKTQADAFNDRLRTAQTKVYFDEVVGSKSDMTWQVHYQIVDNALKNLK